MDDGGLHLDGVENAFLLNPSQQGMLYHTIAEPGTGVYIGVFVCLLPDDLDEAVFKQSWSDVVARHDALRSLFVWEGVDDLMQVVRSDCVLTWEEAAGPIPDENGHADPNYIETIRKEGVDLSQAPAMRFILGRMESGARCFLWSCHHALIDDWSQAIVLKEVQARYQALKDGLDQVVAPATPFASFADWLDQRDKEEDEAYWRSVFAGFSTPTRLQGNRGSLGDSAADDVRGMIELPLSAEVSEGLKKLATKERVTLAAVATAVWSVVVSRLAGENDIAFGLAATQRPPELDDSVGMVGNFVTTMPLRVDLDKQSTMSDVIQHCHEFVQTSQPRSNVSLTKLNKLLSTSSNTQIFDSILSIKQDALGSITDEKESVFLDSVIQLKSSFPLAMVVMPGDPIGLRTIFDPRKFAPEEADRILRIFAAALDATVADSDVPPMALQMQSEDATALALNGLESDIPLGDFPGILPAFRAAVEKMPDQIALYSGDRRLSYADLNAEADKLARYLLSKGIAQGDRIGIFMRRSVDVPVAMLGCLMAGAAYVPFDAAFPEKRLDRMIRDAELSAIVTHHGHFGHLAGQTEHLIDISALPDAAETALPETDDSAPAYVMFTSGSTGEPKGVVVTRANLNASTAARLAYYDDAPDDYLLLSSHAFDSSVAGIYWTLVSGGRLHIADQEMSQDIKALSKILEKKKYWAYALSSFPLSLASGDVSRAHDSTKMRYRCR